QLRNIDRLVTFNWIRKPPLQTGRQGLRVLAELGHHGNLPFLDDDKAAGQPQADQDDDDDGHHLGRALGKLHTAAISRAIVAAAKWAAALGLAPEEGTETIIEIAPDFVQVRRTIALVGPTRRFGAVIVATAPTWIIQIKHFRY